MLLLLPGFDKISEKLVKEIDALLSLLFELNFTGVTSVLKRMLERSPCRAWDSE